MEQAKEFRNLRIWTITTHLILITILWVLTMNTQTINEINAIVKEQDKVIAKQDSLLNIYRDLINEKSK